MKTVRVFIAEWCTPSLALIETFKEIKAEGLPEGVTLEPVDVNENPEEVLRCNVRATPTIIVMNGEKEVVRKVGCLNKDYVLELMKD